MDCESKINGRIKFVKCLSSETVEVNDFCLACRDSERCLTLKPKLAAKLGRIFRGCMFLTEEEVDMLKKDYPEVVEFDKKEGRMKIGASEVKVAYCVSPEPLKEGECEGCRLKECCLLVNPELAEFVDRRKKKNGMYDFTERDLNFLNYKYRDTVEIDQDCSFLCAEAMSTYLIDYYSSSDILQTIVDRKVIFRLMDERYSDNEVELLFRGINAKWEKIEKVFKEIVPREPIL